MHNVRKKTRKLRQVIGNPNLDDELVETLDELNLLYIPSIDDGNCFFYTLESFFTIRKKHMGNYVTVILYIMEERGFRHGAARVHVTVESAADMISMASDGARSSKSQVPSSKGSQVQKWSILQD